MIEPTSQTYKESLILSFVIQEKDWMPLQLLGLHIVKQVV